MSAAGRKGIRYFITCVSRKHDRRSVCQSFGEHNQAELDQPRFPSAKHLDSIRAIPTRWVTSERLCSLLLYHMALRVSKQYVAFVSKKGLMIRLMKAHGPRTAYEDLYLGVEEYRLAATCLCTSQAGDVSLKYTRRRHADDCAQQLQN